MINLPLLFNFERDPVGFNLFDTSLASSPVHMQLAQETEVECSLSPSVFLMRSSSHCLDQCEKNGDLISEFAFDRDFQKLNERLNFSSQMRFIQSKEKE